MGSSPGRGGWHVGMLVGRYLRLPTYIVGSYGPKEYLLLPVYVWLLAMRVLFSLSISLLVELWVS